MVSSVACKISKAGWLSERAAAVANGPGKNGLQDALLQDCNRKQSASVNRVDQTRAVWKQLSCSYCTPQMITHIMLNARLLLVQSYLQQHEAEPLHKCCVLISE